ncbi:MAG: hypothetical protein WKF75_17710 [Singulisphaera sp.]
MLFPGKVVADAKGKRLFVADTGHNRIVMTDLEGKNATTIGSGPGWPTGPSTRLRAIARRGCAWSTTSSTSRTPRTTRSGRWT